MKNNYEVAKEVISGKWGNNPERRTKLTEAGYNADVVQSIVNALMLDREQSAELGNVLSIEFDTSKYNALKINFK